MTDLDVAREYLVARGIVESEHSAELGRRLDEACEELVRLSYLYGKDPKVFWFGMDTELEAEVNGVIDGLLEDMLEQVVGMCELVVDEAEYDILAWLDDQYTAVYGSFRDGLVFYLDRFALEKESLIVSAMLQGMDVDTAIASVLGASKDPWKSSLWTDGLALAAGTEVMASILNAGGVTYGVGRSNVSYNMLDTFTRGGIEMLWMHEWKEIAGAGADYFRSFIADETACSVCKEKEAVGWLPMSEYPEGGWHVNCRCAFIFASRDEVEVN